MTSTSIEDLATRYRKTAKRYRRQERKDAEMAAEWYALAASKLSNAAWLTQHPDLWTKDYTPASQEDFAWTLNSLADLYLRTSAWATKMKLEYYAMANDLLRRIA